MPREALLQKSAQQYNPMDIFKKYTNKKATVATKKKAVSKQAPAVKKKLEVTCARGARAAQILIAPWMSEKALIGTDSGIYVFSIPRSATKQDVSHAIEVVYNVTPRSIRIANLPGKRVSRRTRSGFAVRSCRRKAYVYLAKGDTIQIV